MELKQIACDIWPLIENGILGCMLNRGRKPFALMLHPAHVDEFCRGTETNSDLLDGISVLTNPSFGTTDDPARRGKHDRAGGGLATG